jgi:hypothetical protein
MAKEMALVPMDMLERLKEPSLTQLTNPNKDQVIKQRSEISSILRDTTLPESVKANQIKGRIKDFSLFANKMLSRNIPSPVASNAVATSSDAVPASPLVTLPRTFQHTAKFLMEELEKHPNLVSWDPATHELSIRGKRMRGSNIVDLIGHVLRSRKSARAPVHGNAFLKVLADLNLPEELVRNKYQISKFRSYKQGVSGGGARVRIPTDGEEEEEEVDGPPRQPKRQVISAKRQLKRIHPDGGKSVSKLKSFKWKPI